MDGQKLLELMGGLSKFATPEVLTVFGSIFAVFIGWKATAASIGIVKSFAQKASFLGMTAAVLLVAGLGTAGLGTGELTARAVSTPAKPEKKGISDDKLITLAEKCHDKEVLKLLTEYARVRDGDRSTEDERVLAVLVERAQGKNGDSDKDNKALTAYMEYMKAKELAKANSKTVVTGSDSAILLTTTGVVSDQGEAVKLIEEAKAKDAEAKAKDSLMPIPTSLCLLGVGIGLAVSASCCWKLKREIKSTATA